MAAAYLYGTVTKHPFSDGNKRTAIICTGAFSMANGYELTSSEALLYQMVMDAAAGEISQPNLARRFAVHSKLMTD